MARPHPSRAFPGPPPRTSTPPRAPSGAITTVQPGSPLGIGPVTDPKPTGRRQRLAHRSRRPLRRGEAAPGTGTEVGRAAADHDPPDLAAAAQALLAPRACGRGTRPASSPLTTRVAIVVDRRAAVGKSGLERPDDPLHERLAMLGAHRPGRRERMQLRPPQRLVRVDVPDPGDPRWSSRNDFSGAGPPRRDPRRPVARQLPAERLDPQPSPR